MRTAITVGFCLIAATAQGQEAKDKALLDALRSWRAPLEDPYNAIRPQREKVLLEDHKNWLAITNQAEWEKFRDVRLAALERSLGSFPTPPEQIKLFVTKRTAGDGFVVENLVFESRPGLVVTANRYLPAEPGKAMPGFLIVPSHHNPKSQSELQDMGMTWARQGCVVLVPDMLGHGERAQHPFGPGRQDYYFRYNTGLQLALIGDSLMGWFVWDLRRCLDVLEQTPGVAADKLILLGSVAGGGDPAAVTAALDRRVAAAAVFNFGGPQPETKYPLPENAEATYNYVGGGSWESTRNLRLSGRDGFLPWVIDAAIAPRRLIYAHEFAWDRVRDPVWARLQKIYGFYNAEDRLAFSHGRGSVQGKPPESTHCNNIGVLHREMIHPALERWFGIPKPKEYHQPLPADTLRCLTDAARRDFAVQPLHVLAAKLAERRLASARAGRAKLDTAGQRDALQKAWRELLGVPLPGAGQVVERENGKWPEGWRWKTQVIRDPLDPELAVPTLLLLPVKSDKTTPIVVGVAPTGREGLLRERGETMVQLLRQGIAVCLIDVRGTGARGRLGASAGRGGERTDLSSSEQMYGRTVLGTQVQDLLLVMKTLPFEFGNAAIWAESLTTSNEPALDFEVKDVSSYTRGPHYAEPTLGLAALLTGLYTDADKVPAVVVRGGLASFQDLLRSPFFYVPHETFVSGVLAVGDVDDLAATLAPRGLRLEASIDGWNRLVDAAALKLAFRSTGVTYDNQKRAADVSVRPEPVAGDELVRWFDGQLKARTK